MTCLSTVVNRLSIAAPSSPSYHISFSGEGCGFSGVGYDDNSLSRFFFFFSLFFFFPQLQSTYLKVEVVMVVINNLLELFSIPKMMDSYLCTCNRNTFYAYSLFIVSGHDESTTTFTNINPVL